MANNTSKTLTGARAVVQIDSKVVGVFSSFNYGLTYGVEPIFLLGRFSAAETVYTSQEVVSATGSGLRIYQNGPHSAAMKMPKLQDLLDATYTTLSVHDRANEDKKIAEIVSARVQSYSVDNPAKGISGITFSYIGLKIQDESGDHNEMNGASDLP
jgi:hypothetical protein